MPFPVPSDLGERYSPIYFLAALGSGGIAVSFFMWLLFWVPHPGRPVPIFADVWGAYGGGDGAMRLAIALAAGGIALAATLMVRLLVWNLRSYARWKRTPAYERLRRSNEETQLLALPLTVAMSLNVGFIVALVFVPGTWSIAEALFPAAIVAYLAVGGWALALLGDFWGRLFAGGGFDCARNNSFSQLLPAFALAMVGVGLAAPAAMSATPVVAALSYILSTHFVVLALVLAGIKLVLGVRAMMEHGADAESAPSLWIVVPIVTVTGIALMRHEHGLHAHFGAHGTAVDGLRLLTVLLAVQVAFTLFGWMALQRQGYFRRFVFGGEHSPGSYALICPGVALAVMGHFFVNKGIVAVGLVAKFSAVYWVLTAIPIALQVLTIGLLLRLYSRTLATTAQAEAKPVSELSP